MAYEETLTNVTLDAGTGVGVYTGVPGMPGSADPNGGVQYYFLKLSATAREVVLAEADEGPEVVVGVLQNKPQAVGQPATVAISGVSLVALGEDSVTANSPVKIDATGRAVAATLPTDEAIVVGRVLAGGDTGHLVPCLLKLGS